jgi:restriction system protein
MDKRSELLALAKRRQVTRWNGYGGIGDHHASAYECDFVSPYTKTAGNLDAEVMVMLQDWSSDESLKESFDEETAKLGYTQSLPTNRNLVELLNTTFGIALRDTYATNLFPFVKPGKMSERIPQAKLIDAAQEFALPQIRIVNPKLVICLGLATFNALRQACELSACRPLSVAIDNPFSIGTTRVWCQAHTGVLGQNNRNRGGIKRVPQDWLRMRRMFIQPRHQGITFL